MYTRALDVILEASQLGDAGTLTLTDLQVINRGGPSDFNAPLSSQVTLFRRTPAGSRPAALPAVLTVADNDGIVVLTGTSGALSVDVSFVNGCKVLVVNEASGIASYSGITGLLGTTSLSPGSSATVYMANGVVKATASAGSSGSATAYSMVESASFGLVNTAITLTFAPSSGTWPTGITLTPAQSGVTAVFSPTTLTPTAGSTGSVSCTMTPSTAGTSTISVTNSGSLTNPGNLTYVSRAAATAYTTGLSGSSGLTNAAMTMTFTPTSGGWPASEVITPTVSGVSGTFSPATVSTTAGSTTAVTTLFTPTSAGTAALNSTTSPSMTNTTGSQNYTVTAPVATAYTTGLSASSGAISAPVTMTFTPTGGGWPGSQTITPTATGLTGTFSPASINPTAGSTAAVTSTFTPSASGTGSLDSTVAVSMTDTSGAQGYTVSGSGPAYPTITTGGVTRLAIFDSNVGVTSSGGNVTALADQSGGGNDLAASVGVSVGANVNGYPSIAFAASARASNSGLAAAQGGSWIGSTTGMENNSTVAFAIKTGATVTSSASQYVFVFSPSSYVGSYDYGVYFDTAGKMFFYSRMDVAYYQQISPGAVAINTVYKGVIKRAVGSTSLDVWLNGTKTTYTVGSQGTLGVNQLANFSIGQGTLAGYGSTGLTGARFLELHAMSGLLSDTDAGTYATYLTNKWGS